MNFVKITNRQINTLKNLPSNLNDSLSSQNISGLIVLDKQGQFKQTIFDFQTSSLEEFYVGKNKVRVNAVASGPLSTTAAKNIPGFSAMNDEWNERAPLGWDTKNAEPVAKVINFLLSDYSEAITGEIIHVDGGAHAIGGSMLPD